MGTSKLYEHSERVWREMYRQSLPLTLLIKGVGLPSGGDVPCHAGRSGA